MTLYKTNNQFLSSIVFYLGLCLIFVFKAELFTGSVLTLSKEADYLNRVFDIWIGNLLGSIATTILLYQVFQPYVYNIISVKLSLDPIQMMISGVFCNILVCSAVFLYRKHKNHLLCGFIIMCFILLGAEHSVANMSYFTIGAINGFNILDMICSMFFVSIGNFIGGRIIVMLEEDVNYEN